MFGLTIMWFFIWIYIARNFHHIMATLGVKHTPRKIQAEVDPIRKWKFENTRTSLIHAILVGVWAVVLLIKNPSLFTDLNNYDDSVMRMACCSFGYFLYDSIDMIKGAGLRNSLDLLVHHAIVFGHLFYLGHNKALVGGIAVGLAVELANITLHIRMILKMSGRNPQNSRFYANFRWLNLLCYGGVRLIFHSRITVHSWKFLNNPDFPFCTAAVFTSINILNIMIAIFAYRLIKTDFLGGWKKSAGEYATDIRYDTAAELKED
ncbi:unnamed protein product [Oikopleura dioica]|uniref:TLC domain-containing protein n=1 Tax=Oikopleura dioica TaxID=34765 RepID=E4XFZ2_OIKDI|nr:unnamed protein product [Oikopleura dioica]